jgi:hypothetical protein
MNYPNFPSQGQKIASNWDAEAALQDITAYVGTDGKRFAPVDDRKGYAGGIERNMNTGGILMAGMPVVRWVSPWISDGQLHYLKHTLLAGGINVTIATHIPGDSVGKNAVSHFNAELNLRLNQLQSLTRKGSGYLDYVWELVIVEVL